MSIQAITVTKAKADSKLGFGYSTLDGRTTVTSVSDEGLFTGTAMKQGQEILTINGSPTRSVGGPAMADLLSSLGDGEVTVVVEDFPDVDDKMVFSCTPTKDRRGSVHGEMKTLKKCPQILEDAGVPRDVWMCIHSLIATKLLPAAVACLRQNESYQVLLAAAGSGSVLNYVDINVRQTHGMKVCMLHNNATIAAVAVRDQVNSLLSKYGVAAVLDHETYDSVNKSRLDIVTGFSFYKM